MKVVKYILGVTLLFGGFASISESKILSGFLALIIGVIILPPISEQLKERFKFWQNKGLRYVVYVFLFFFFGITLDKQKAKEKAQSPEGIVEDFVKSHSKNPLITTIDSLKDIERTFNTDGRITFSGNSEYERQNDGSIIYSPKFNKRDSLYKDYQKSEKKMLDYDLIFNIKNGIVSSVKASVLHYGDNDRVLYDSLNLPAIASWLNRKEIEKMKAAKSKLEEVQRNLSDLTKKQEDWQRHCISSWDGSCPKLVRFLENNLKDPDSFEHIETYVKYGDDYVTVIMKYRAKNSFGGYNIEAVTGQVGYDCDVLGISQ